jgi:co-chaperonin GroES (HSP10)
MIKPINYHVLIEPLKQEGFISSQNDVYQEIGVVRAMAPGVELEGTINIGDRVYFDGWIAAKYPTGDGENYFWLVPYHDVRAVDHAQD